MKKIITILLLVFSALLFVGCSDDGEVAGVQSARPFKGQADSRIVVTEYSDFQCPACSQVQPVLAEILDKYSGQIRFEYYHFPLESVHDYAFSAAVASECANEQGRFWEYHDLLFENQENLKNSDLKLYATEIEGMDAGAFNTCLDSERTRDIVKSDLKEAAALKLRGTPSFFVNGKKVPSADQIDSYIQLEMQ